MPGLIDPSQPGPQNDKKHKLERYIELHPQCHSKCGHSDLPFERISCYGILTGFRRESDGDFFCAPPRDSDAQGVVKKAIVRRVIFLIQIVAEPTHAVRPSLPCTGNDDEANSPCEKLVMQELGYNGSPQVEHPRRLGFNCLRCLQTSRKPQKLPAWGNHDKHHTILTHRFHPLQPIFGACSIEKYPSSRMANRYTRIFDAG